MQVTTAAVSRLARILQEAELPNTYSVRLTAVDGDLEISLDHARPGDHVITRAGRVMLLYDAATADALSDRCVDTLATAEGDMLVLT